MLLFINHFKGRYNISANNGWIVLQHCACRYENVVALLHLQVQYISNYHAGNYALIILMGANYHIAKHLAILAS